MGWYSKKPGKAPWLSTLIIIALVCLMGACGTTGPGTGGGAGTATPGSSPAPVATRTAYDRSGCAGQAGLLSIRMLDSSQGWALNENAVLKTFDGGLHWHCATPTSMRPGMTAGGTFMDLNNAWVVPEQQSLAGITIWLTHDGGQHWQNATIHGSQLEPIEPPHFLTTQQGWIEVATNGGPGAGSESVALFHTSDGGLTWSQLASTDDPRSGLSRGGLKSGISFKDALNGWATGHDASFTPWLYVTHDGGKTWRQLPYMYPRG